MLAGGRLKVGRRPPTCCSTCACRWSACRKAAVRCAWRSARAATGALTVPALREFRTTLSEPVDDEQWRTLGEGAAYRVAADLANTRITRPALRIEPELGMQQAAPCGGAAAPAEPLDLRLEQRIAPRSGSACFWLPAGRLAAQARIPRRREAGRRWGRKSRR